MFLPWLLLIFVLSVAIWGAIHTLHIKAREHKAHHHTSVEKF